MSPDFKPREVPLHQLIENHLPVKGFEAPHPADDFELKHEEAAAKMNVSRRTQGRMVSRARQAVAKALVDGTVLRIHGGDYLLNEKSGIRSQSLDHLCLAQSGAHAPAGSSLLGIKEADMPKIAISCEGPDLEDALDPRFGRAAGFLLVDPHTLKFEYLDNGASQTMAQGAGIQAAETIAASGAEVLLTGYVGPKAFKALKAAGIRVAQDLENVTARQALERFNNGQVAWIDASSRRGHGR